jgi:hypothetical protein
MGLREHSGLHKLPGGSDLQSSANDMCSIQLFYNSVNNDNHDNENNCYQRTT